MDSSCYYHCTICYSSLDLRPGGYEENWSENDLVETLHKILHLKEWKEEYRTHPSHLFCSSCIDEMERITETLTQYNLILTKLKGFRQNIEEFLVRSFMLQEELCGKNEGRRNAESDTHSWALRSKLLEKINQDERRRKRIEQILEVLTRGTSEQSETGPAAAQSATNSESPSFELPSPPPSWIHDDDEDVDCPEPMEFIVSTESQSVVIQIQDQDDLQTQSSDSQIPIANPTPAEKSVKIQLHRIDTIYPQLRNTNHVENINSLFSSRIDNCSDNNKILDEDNLDFDILLPPPENLLDMSYYNLPTRCLVPGCPRVEPFHDKARLRKHIKEMHVNGPVPHYDPFNVLTYPTQCPHSGCAGKASQFHTKADLLQHMEECHTRIDTDTLNAASYHKFPTKCKEPGCRSKTKFIQRYALLRHLRDVHCPTKKAKDPILECCTYPTKCPIPGCKRTTLYNEKSILKRHLRFVHTKKTSSASTPTSNLYENLQYPTKCPHAVCRSRSKTKQYPNFTVLKRHLKEIHERPNQAVQCEHCGKLCPSPMRLRSHLKVHERSNILICEDCGSTFKTEAGLKAHRDTHHAEIEPHFPCTLCPKTFKIKRGLLIHMERHEGVKKEFCTLCPAGFLFKWELRNHNQYHHAEELKLKKVECGICGKHFTKPSNLDHHMVMHTGKGAFQCDLCVYSTARRVDLKEHVDTVHSKHFGFECGECGKKFKLERRLRSHELSHKGFYDLECGDCQQRFMNPKTLRVHRRRKHGETFAGAQQGQLDEQG